MSIISGQNCRRLYYLSTMDKALRNELIVKYRASIAERYNFDKLENDPKLPEGFTRDTIDQLRDFFLENLYSAPKEREKLDAAFKQLETYVAHPTKIWGLLGNMLSAIFEFGTHFPAAIKIGLSSLKTHTSARQFEEMLLQGAKDKGFGAPMTEEQFYEAMATIPTENLQTFVDDLVTLFSAITDEVMLHKTISILKGVLTRMKEKKNVYGKADVDAIQLGVDILTKGDNLLSKLSPKMKKDLVQYVAYMELEFIKSLHTAPKKKKKK